MSNGPQQSEAVRAGRQEHGSSPTGRVSANPTARSRFRASGLLGFTNIHIVAQMGTVLILGPENW